MCKIDMAIIFLFDSILSKMVHFNRKCEISHIFQCMIINWMDGIENNLLDLLFVINFMFIRLKSLRCHKFD